MRSGCMERLDFHDEPPHDTFNQVGTGEASEWLKRLINDMNAGSTEASWPLAVKGTAFQQRVWAAIRCIPRGERRTYSELAHSLGCPKAVRAVANACASNVLAYAIPCHRVVRSDGGLGGYRWGIERKARLLQWESSGR